MEHKVRGRALEGCGWRGPARGGPCELVESLVELYSEVDTKTLEVEVVRFAELWVPGEQNGMRGLGSERPFRLMAQSTEEIMSTWTRGGSYGKKWRCQRY